MSRYTFRVRNKGREGGVGVSAFYGEVGWDEELATFYARLWREAAEEPLVPAHHEPLVSCGRQLCEVTDVARLEWERSSELAPPRYSEVAPPRRSMMAG